MGRVTGGSGRLRTLGALVVVCAACAPAGDGGTSQSLAPPTTASSVVPPSVRTSPPVPSRQELTLRGRVQAGVEPGCVVLVTETGLFLLLGADPRVVRAGAEVVVEGAVRPGQATTCQQGTPFAVREARPAP